ncbi:hypothetical protein [Streptomyces sp. DSM 118148]|uniref:hypothetical protein n=1 Tax=Streptomyces sp. DSM 118148 TaxID=3448667 RepID=UPI00403FEAAA
MNAHAIPGADEDELFEALQWIYPGLQRTEDGFTYINEGQIFEDRAERHLKRTQINAIAAGLEEASIHKESGLVWSNKAEFLLAIPNDYGAFDRFLEDKTILGDGESSLKYSTGRPSAEFTAFLLATLSSNEEVQKSRLWATFRRRARWHLSRRNMGYRVRTGSSLLDLAATFLTVSTLRIEAPKPRSDFERLANSFLFHAAYNMDVAAHVSNGFEALLRRSKIQKVRRADAQTIDAPRQSYDADLVHHYTMGVSAESPLLEYISYYHIAEHFFEKVFNDDLVDQVRDGIIAPSFSVRRNTDVQGIIKIVTRVQRQVKEEGGVNEQRALQLVLAKFVDIERLILDLEAYDEALIDHYRDNSVSFAEAGKVDLRKADTGEVAKDLAKRIYKVRNSLVHAKEGVLPKYAPFTHDSELSREVPLMRFAAEQILITHGRPI